MAAKERKYWLMKSEPDCYSIDDLRKRTVDMWDGIRNYQARNLMRDAMKQGDIAFFYHSSAGDATGIAGLMEIAGEAHPDPTQFDPQSEHPDPRSDPTNPRWLCVDVRFVERFPRIVTLAELKNDPFFGDMVLTEKGSRLSVQPVAKKHFDRICKLARA